MNMSIIKDQSGIIQNLQMSPIPQISFLVGNFFAASYSKTALDVLKHHKSKHCTYYVRTNHISHRDRIVCLSALNVRNALCLLPTKVDFFCFCSQLTDLYFDDADVGKESYLSFFQGIPLKLGLIETFLPR